jgi:tRNA(Ile)-lysidine synthase
VHPFVRNLITEWRRLEMPFKEAAVVVAVSGGADSMSLLAAIHDLRERKKLELRIAAAHFNHKLRPDSHTDCDFVADFARSHRFEFAHSEWKREAGGNLEQSARDARYRFLRETADSIGTGYVLTAHTMSDQAETFLMNLIRGAGPDGLSGIKPKRALAIATPDDEGEPFLPFAEPEILVVRPLLRWAKRRDTENFCLEHKIEFCRDPMNEDLNFRRVWVRKVLIPMMEEANPKIVESLCRTAELMAELPASASGRISPPARIESQTGQLDLAHLRTLEKADLFPVLRDWIRLHRGNLRGIAVKHTESIYNLIHSKKSGRVAELPGGDVVKHDGRLSWQTRTTEKG